MKVLIFFFVAVVGMAAALSCYECNSAVDPACDDMFAADSEAMQKAFLKECLPAKKDGEAAFCRKTKMWFELTGETRVHRDCAYKRREDHDCYQQRSEDHVVDVCQCDEEACNAAPNLGSRMVTSLVMAVGALLFAKI